MILTTWLLGELLVLPARQKVFAVLVCQSCLDTFDDFGDSEFADAETTTFDASNWDDPNTAYAAALDSITSLRQQFPRAVNARRRALEIWQEASLKMTQDDIGRTDSALQAVTRQMEAETNIYKRNMLGVKRDSLQARYEGLIGTVRVIHKKMEENK